MKGFIEVTKNEDGLKVLLSIEYIMGVVFCDDGSVFIEMGYDGEGLSSGISVADTFDEVKEKIQRGLS